METEFHDTGVETALDVAGAKGTRGITPGVVDAAMSSLATFIAALVAANILTDAELGVYAVFYTAFNFGQVIANNLVYIPAEVVAVSWPEHVRIKIIRQSIPLGITPSVIGALAIGVAGLITIQITTASFVLPLALTAGLTTLLWPTQDHVRRTLHIANKSWAAAAVSVAQFVTVVGSIGVFLLAGVPDVWIPYGSLALANAASLLVGLILARWSVSRERAPERLNRKSLTQSGAWLLVGVGTPTVTAFAAATIITFAAGPEALGFAEAARVAAHPILVLGTGLGYVLGPKIMTGALAGDQSVSRTNHFRFNAIVVSAALAYVAVAGWDWAGNPMAAVLPKAFEIAWLVPATILANILLAALVLVLQELMAAQRARVIAIVSLLAAPFQLAAAATASVTEAFARPLSLVIGNGARLYGNARTISRVYSTEG
ncbi:MAG: hypothetical protein QNJ77_12715 [Acidimicrobiia bacterium]|nr:hypothetical protein [Acidimicrobiia bacterium]